MRGYRSAFLCFAAVAALAFAADTALAQKVFSRGPTKNVTVKGPVRGASTPKFGARDADIQCAGAVARRILPAAVILAAAIAVRV